MMKAENISELGEVARLNEGIKQVMNISRQVNMAALNSMLMAKKANGRVAGYAVVSSELRMFSDRLAGQMREFSERSSALVSGVALFRKHEKMNGYLSQLAEKCDASKLRLREVRARKRLEIEEARKLLAADRNWLRAKLYHAMRLCDSGRTLSRSARIEAVHGGDMAHSLSQVSIQVESTIEHVTEIFKSLEKQLQE